MSHTPDPKDLKDEAHTLADTVTDTVKAINDKAEDAVDTIAHAVDKGQGMLDDAAHTARTMAGNVVGVVAEAAGKVAEQAEMMADKVKGA